MWAVAHHGGWDAHRPVDPTGLSREAQRQLYEHYEARRLEKLALLRRERQELIEEGWEPPESKHKSKGNMSVNVSSVTDSTILEREQRKLEAMQRRQQQEIEQMLAYELKMAKLREEQDRRLQQEREREEQERRRRLEKQKEWERQRREMELAKKRQEEREEEERR